MPVQPDQTIANIEINTGRGQVFIERGQGTGSKLWIAERLA